MLSRIADLLVLGSCLLWTVLVLGGLRHRSRVLIAFLVTTCLAGAAQAAANEVRWSMVPAFVFLLAASLRAALDLGSTGGLPGPRWRRVATRGVLVAVALAVVALPTWLFPRIAYARPTGPYAVGVRSEFWVDSTRAETYTADPGDVRRLLVEIWYPAEPGRDAVRARAHPRPDVLARDLTAAMPGGMPAFIFRGIGSGLTWAWIDQPVSGAERSFPLLVFSHGFGGTRTQNTFEMAELASHGYVVASVEHTWTAIGTVFPDGSTATMDTAAGYVLKSDSTSVRVVNIRAADGRFVIDRMFGLDRADPRRMLTGRIDTTRVGYFGHSFGGATAAQVMSLDPRVRTGINMDGYLAGTAWVQGLDRPFLQLRSDPVDVEQLPEKRLAQAGTSREELRGIVRTWAERTGAVIRGGGAEVHLRGTAHNNYSDMPLFSPVLMRMARQAGPIAPARAHRLVNEITLAWFDRYVKGKPAPSLADLAARHPEIELVR